MKPYWNSEHLTFSSGGKVTRGYSKTLKGYKQRYPDAKTMGTLSFEQLEFQTLGKDAMQVLGIWKLARDNQPLEGRFTLVLQHEHVGSVMAHMLSLFPLPRMQWPAAIHGAPAAVESAASISGDTPWNTFFIGSVLRESPLKPPRTTSSALYSKVGDNALSGFR